VKEDPDAIRIAGIRFRVVIAGLPVVTRGCCLTLWIGKTKTPGRDVGALKTALARHPHSASAERLSATAKAGEGDHWSSRSERTVVEGAHDSELRCGCKKMTATKLLRSRVEEK
jgi:hypothetical protein